MLPFVGPTYDLDDSKVSCQRAVNLYLKRVETPEKGGGWIMPSVPGIKQFVSGLAGPLRWMHETRGRTFAVAGNTFYEVFANGTSVAIGVLLTSLGPVDIDSGNTQVVVVDGDNGYVFSMSSGNWNRITSPGWRGSKRVAFLNNYFVFSDPGTGVMYWSGIDDATSFYGLDFITAESQPDNLITVIRDNEELRALGEASCEMYTTSQSTTFAKRGGASSDIGCIAPYSARTADNSTLFIGGDKNGGGIVYMMRAYQPQRVSNSSIEEKLQGSGFLHEAVGWTYQDKGLTFYCIDAPGLETTLVYEIASGQWHERAEIDAVGQWRRSRITCHAYAFGRHLVGDLDGNIGELDSGTYQNLGAPLVRERVSPHTTKPGLGWISAPAFIVDCETGRAPVGVNPMIELSYSRDSGATWSNPRPKSMGLIGQRLARVVWTCIGRWRERVWRVRCSANAPFTLIDANVGDV